MSAHTRLAKAELEQILDGYGCGTLNGYQPIHQGVTNSNFEIVCNTQVLILTLYEQADPTTVLQKVNLQTTLNQHSIPCAQFLENRKGETVDEFLGKPVTLQCKLAGTIGYSITSELCQQVGRLLAQFHLAVADYSDIEQNPRGVEWIYSTVDLLEDRLSDKDYEIVMQELNYLGRFSELSLPAAVVHGDLFPDNVLVEDGQINAILDFDYACREILMFDLGIAINAWCSREDGSLDRLLMRDFLQAYSDIRPLSEHENLSIPMVMRWTALRFWLSRLHDQIMVDQQDDVQHKNADEFKRILLSRRQRLSGMQR